MAGEAGHLVGLVREIFRRDARCRTHSGRSPRPRCDINLARAALRLKPGACGSTLSLTSDTSHSSSGSTIERWTSTRRPSSLAIHSKRRRPSSLRSRARLVPLGGAAGPGGQQVGIFGRGAVAVLAADLDRVGDLAVDEAVAVAVLGEMAVGALHALLGMDVHHVDRLALLLAGLDELGGAGLPELLGIVGRDDRCRRRRADCPRGRACRRPGSSSHGRDNRRTGCACASGFTRS